MVELCKAALANNWICNCFLLVSCRTFIGSWHMHTRVRARIASFRPLLPIYCPSYGLFNSVIVADHFCLLFHLRPIRMRRANWNDAQIEMNWLLFVCAFQVAIVAIVRFFFFRDGDSCFEKCTFSLKAFLRLSFQIDMGNNSWRNIKIHITFILMHLCVCVCFSLNFLFGPRKLSIQLVFACVCPERAFHSTTIACSTVQRITISSSYHRDAKCEQ